MNNTIRIEGLNSLQQLLRGVEPRHVRPLYRATLLGIAAAMRDKARQLAPVRAGNRKIKRSGGKFRKPGNLKKSISAKSLQARGAQPQSAIVYVKSGSKYPADGYYWRFVDQGATTRSGGRSRARPFIARAENYVRANMGAIIDQKFTAAFNRRMQAELARQARRAAT